MARKQRLPAHEAAYARLRASMERDARSGVIPGVLLDVHGLGVLLQGPSGVGKSALAMELILRGHRLVADDAVEVSVPADGVLVGRAPELLRGHIEVRGVGIVNLRSLHGARALRDSARIDLVVDLGKPKIKSSGERLGVRRSYRRILGVRVDRIHLDPGARRLRSNLPALVETACLDQEMRLLGISAIDVLERRQSRAIRKTSRAKRKTK